MDILKIRLRNRINGSMRSLMYFPLQTHQIFNYIFALATSVYMVYFHISKLVLSSSGFTPPDIIFANIEILHVNTNMFLHNQYIGRMAAKEKPRAGGAGKAKIATLDHYRTLHSCRAIDRLIAFMKFT